MQKSMEKQNPYAHPPTAAQLHELDEQFPINTIRSIPRAKKSRVNSYEPAAENGIHREPTESGGNQLTPPHRPYHGLPHRTDAQHVQTQLMPPASGDQGYVNPLPHSRLEEAKMNPIKFMAQGHIPDHLADPFTRLRCFIIDFVLSPSLITSPHNPGPYFPNHCYTMEFSTARGNLDQAVRAYGLFQDIDKMLVAIDTRKQVYTNAPGYVYYSIECSVEVFYASGNPLKIPMSNGAFPAFKDKLGPVWRFETELVVDFSGLSWECLVQLLACYAKIAFYSNGMSRSGMDARDIAAEIDGGNLGTVGKDMWRLVRLGGFGHTVSSLTNAGGDESLSLSVTASKGTESESDGSRPS